VTVRPTSLDTALVRRRVVVCCGSGGVGKTTTAAALGLRAAALGRRAAVLTIDPARRLADALGVPALDNEPREVSRALHEGTGRLDALMLDTGVTFDDMVARLVADPARRRRLLDDPVYRVMGRGLAGSLEYMAVERLYNLVESGRYDIVVLDTPPAQNALDFLDAPSVLLRMFDPRVIRFFAPDPGEERTVAGRLLARGRVLVQQLLARFLGESFASDVFSFFEAFRDLNVPVRERGERVRTLLTGSETGFLVVTGPDPVRVREATALGEVLYARRLGVEGFLVNRVQMAVDGPPPEDLRAELLMPGFDHLPPPHRAAAAARLAEALRNNQERLAAMARRDAAGLDLLRRAVGTAPLWVVPQAAEARDQAAVLTLLRDHLFAPAPAGA
jgi:anion-transporting  ArsA/GET3 family ATPase